MDTPGGRIWHLIQLAGLATQDSFARELGVGPVTVNTWVRDRRTPQPGSYAKIAKLLGISPQAVRDYVMDAKELPLRLQATELANWVKKNPTSFGRAVAMVIELGEEAVPTLEDAVRVLRAKEQDRIRRSGGDRR